MSEPLKHPLAPEERVGYALVGIGKLAEEEILPALEASKRSRLAALVTSDLEDGKRLARRYGLSPEAVYGYDDYDRLADNPGVHAVYIILPNHLHEDYTVRAARMGKHVLCEKPMANSVAEGERMIAACRAAGVKLMIAYRCQYEPHHWAVREMVQQGRFGAVKLVESVHCQVETDPDEWRLKRKEAGGGPLVDIGVYSLNTIRFVLGLEPVEVFAQTYATPDDPRFREVEEQMSWQMRFENGVLAACLTGYSAFRSSRYRLYAEGGWVGLDPAFDYRGLHLSLGREEEGQQVVEERRFPAPNQFALELDHFARCIQEDLTPFTPGEEGLQDLRLVEALYTSARTGRPVRLEVPDKPDAFRGEWP